MVGYHDNRALVEAELKDVGDQALIRGLDTAFPILRPGLFLSYCGRRLCRPQSAKRKFPCRCPASANAREMYAATMVWAGLPPLPLPT
jgi:hypothetical protein